MKKATVGLVVLVLSLLVARAALADARYTDPAGDSGAAPDITTVAVSHDTARNVTITVTTDRSALPEQAVLTLFFDADGNSATGGNGVEYYLVYGATGGIFYRWNGSSYVEADAPTLSVRYGAGELTFRINASDLGGPDDFVFYVTSQQYNAAGAVIASDDAPNDGGYDYRLTTPAAQPLALRASAPAASPSPPVAGKTFVVRMSVTRSDTGARVTTGTVTCRATLALKPLRSVGSIRAGRPGCTTTIPRTARGKRLRGTIRLTFRSVSVTRSFSYLVR